MALRIHFQHPHYCVTTAVAISLNYFCKQNTGPKHNNPHYHFWTFTAGKKTVVWAAVSAEVQWVSKLCSPSAQSDKAFSITHITNQAVVLIYTARFTTRKEPMVKNKSLKGLLPVIVLTCRCSISPVNN